MLKPPRPATDWIPRTRLRFTPHQPIVIQLTARDNSWAQFAYQFSHEFCHVLSNYETLEGDPNNWFHEAICELASVFTLRRMVERWPTDPPYPNWATYAKSLEKYVKKLFLCKARQLPEHTTLRDWLSSHEEGLRQDREQRDKNAVVAYALLPVFESHIGGWNAIGKLPSSSVGFESYLSEWYSSVDSMDKPFVAYLGSLFNFDVNSERM